MSEITKSPQTMADDATVGTVAWSNPDNAKVSDDVYAVCSSSPDDYPNDRTVKIVKSDGSIGTTNKAIAGLWSSTEAYVSYGSSSDLWGETWTPADINDVDFGIVLSINLDFAATIVGHYLKATNFGFSIPTGATINGFLVEIEKYKYDVFSTYTAKVDHIRITVYFQDNSIVSPFPTFFQIHSGGGGQPSGG